MRFNSYLFLFALPIVAAVLWLLPRRARRVWLLLVSYAFYASWNLLFLALLVSCGTLNYFGAKWIAKNRAHTQRIVLVVSANVILLAVFKYMDWLCGNVNALALLLGSQARLPLPHWALPLGISFYVFESISYVVDVKRGREKPRNLFELQLFLAFFPKLIAGPILRGREFFHQLELARPPDASALLYALRQITIGLFFKCVLVDRAVFGLADNVNEAFSRPYHLATAIDVWVMSLAFSLQIYFDYSAYTRIALGSARLCGITLVENFDYPFMATTPSEFWQRWNISLSRWVRDYLFMPLQGGLENANRLRTAWAALASMVVFGVWHGAGWNFVAWGAYNGIILTGYHLLVPASGAARGQRPLTKWLKRIGGWIVTTALFCLGVLFWRHKAIAPTFDLFLRAVRPWAFPGIGLRRVFVAITFEFVTCVLIAGLIRGLARRGEIRNQRLRYGLAALEGLAIGVLLVLSIIHMQNRRAFVYFQF